MTASKIAAVVGTSKYESRFSLWHRMNGTIGPQEQNDEMVYGHYLEPVLLKWFADQHPEMKVSPGRWFEREGWAGATPDGIAGDGEGWDLIQCKTDRIAWEWAQGIPPGYYDQVQWEMWVSGADVCWIAADIAMEFRDFRIDRDNDRIDFLVRAADDFMKSLAAGVQPPLDGSMNTYEAVRELHPDISPEDADVPTELAHRWLTAKANAAEWAAAEQQAKNEIAALMGDARRARWDGTTLFTRQARAGGTPYLVCGRNLPEIGSAA